MKKVVIFLLTSLLAAGIFPANAQPGSCFRVRILFTPFEETTLTGKLATQYRIGENEIGFVDFEFGDRFEDLDAGERVELGSFTIENKPRSAFELEIREDAADIDGDGDFRVVINSCDAQPTALNDGRLNPNDAGAISTIYPDGKNYDVYSISADTGVGVPAFRVTQDQVNAALATATAPDGANTLVAQEGGISFWALTTNECQLNTFRPDGGLEEFVFECASDE